MSLNTEGGGPLRIVRRLAGTKAKGTFMCKIDGVIKSIALLLILQECGRRRGISHDVHDDERVF